MPRGVSWHSILRGTLYPIGHERRISFLRADCIFAFEFFSSHLEITLLFCSRYFCYCTHAFELQCFWALHRPVYRSWCVNSCEQIHGNLELEAVIATKDLLDLLWWKQSSTRHNHWHQQVGNPHEKPRGQSQVQVQPQVAQAHYERSAYINLFHFAYIMTSAKYKSLYEKCCKCVF